MSALKCGNKNNVERTRRIGRLESKSINKKVKEDDIALWSIGIDSQRGCVEMWSLLAQTSPMSDKLLRQIEGILG